MAQGFESLEGNGFSFSREFARIHFGDSRLDARFIFVMEGLFSRSGGPINRAFPARSSSKAAYRLFQNEKVSVEEILDVHRSETIQRMSAYPEVLVVQDTTTLSFNSHPRTQGLGRTGTHENSGFGILAHTSLAMSLEGTPLGIVDQKLWSRGELPVDHELWGSEAEKWRLSLAPLIAAKSSGSLRSRIITVCDRESDITEFIATHRSHDLSFVIRGKKKRQVESEIFRESIGDFLKRQPQQFQYEVEAKSKKALAKEKGQGRKALEESRRRARLAVHAAEGIALSAPSYLRKSFAQLKAAGDLRINAVLVQEVSCPLGEEEIEWILLTDLPVGSQAEIEKVIRIYRQRWGIETFHKVLKSGCKVEECRLEAAERLQRFICASSIVAYRLYLLARLNRETPEAPCTGVLEEIEWKVLCLIHKKPTHTPPTLDQAVRLIAQLGGFMGTTKNAPGVITLWRGWQELQMLVAGYRLAAPQ